MTKTYIIDNGRSCSDHKIFFVDADPTVFDPLWTAYEKAWPDNCLRCGKMEDGEKCPASPRNRHHEMPERFSLIAIADKLDWRDPEARMTLASWLDWNDCNFHDYVCDLAAANEFRRLGQRVWPYFLNWASFDLRTYER